MSGLLQKMYIARTEIEIRGAEVLQGALKCLSSISVVGVVQLGDEIDLLARNTRGLDTLSDLTLIA